MEESTQAYYLQLTARYLRDEATEFEKNLLLEWTQENPENKSSFIQWQKAWKLTENINENFHPDVDIAWAKVKNKLQGLTINDNKHVSQESTTKVRTLQPLWTRWAAGILLLLGISMFFIYRNISKEQNITIASTDTQKVVVLPDSSRILLNKNSMITYSAGFKEKRELKLEGEAFFEVRKDASRPFYVQTSRSLTRVIGTSFNIVSKSEMTSDRIQVFSGKVAFSAIKNSAKPVYLTRGWQAEIQSDSLSVDTLITNTPLWNTQELKFEDARLKHVFNTLEDYFQIHIRVTDPDILECSFTGTFRQPSLEDVLEVLTVSANIQIQKNHPTYLITGQGCK